MQTDGQGKGIVCDFCTSNKERRVYCVYAPNQCVARYNFPFVIDETLETDKTVVLLGNFNCVRHPEDRANSDARTGRSARFLSSIVDELNLLDVGVRKCGNERVLYTQFRGTTRARLDRNYIPHTLFNNVSKYRVRGVDLSDHSRQLWEKI